MNPAIHTWLLRPKPNLGAALRLLCFPYAGAGAAAFRSWVHQLPSSIELCGVEIPGRGMRFADKPMTSAVALAETLAGILVHALDRPFALFGHSMGALLAFEIIHLLHDRHGLLPEYLFASAAPAPHLPVKKPTTYDFPEPELIAKLTRMNGTPAEVLTNPGLRAVVLPIIRADFSVVQTYVYKPGPKLNFPICAMGGSEDPEVSENELQAWREETSGPFTLEMLPGDHFFLHTGQRLLLELIAKRLNSAVAGCVPQAGTLQDRG